MNKKLFAESSIPSDGLDPSQEFMSLKLGITGCGKNGEGYSIPLSMARPRSNSGSRYLSDKVSIFISSFVIRTNIMPSS